jgi:hypothetical protein
MFRGNILTCVILAVTLALHSAGAAARGHAEDALGFNADFAAPTNCKPIHHDPHGFKKSCFITVEHLHPVLISLDENYYGYSEALDTGRVELEVIAWRIGEIEEDIAMEGEGWTELAYTKRRSDHLPRNASALAATCIQYHRSYENLMVRGREGDPFITRIDAMICANQAEAPVEAGLVAHIVELSVQEVYSPARDHIPIDKYDEIVRSVFASLKM